MKSIACAFEFEEQQLRVYSFRGRPCWIAQDVGAVLGYTPKGFRQVLSDWGDEIILGKDVHTLRGADLREFKAMSGASPESGLAKTTQIAILFESGVDLVCLKTDKPMGRKLRRFMVDVVMPKLRRGELVESDASRELVALTLRLQPSTNNPTIWELETVNEICRLYGKAKWDGVGRFPHWIQEPLGRIYQIVLGDVVYRELKQRNPDPRDGSLNYQFLTEARHRLMQERDMERVLERLRESLSREEFFNRLAFAYRRAPLQLGWGAA